MRNERENSVIVDCPASCFGQVMLTILLIVLLVLALGGGGLGHSRYVAVSWSPLGLIVVVFLLLYFTGRLV